MSDSPTATGKSATGKKLAHRFTVEFGDDFGRRPFLHTFRKFYRGRWSLSALASRKMTTKTGREKRLGAPPVGEFISQMPDLPGIHLEIDLARRTAREYDPLADDEERLAAACRAFGKSRNASEYYAAPWPEVKYDSNRLDENLIKTLAREVLRLVDDGSARIVAGEPPTLEEVASLPGRFLADRGYSGRGPVFEDEALALAEKLAAATG